MKRMIQAAALVAGLGVASAAQGALVTFQVDPTQSVIELTDLSHIGNTLADDLNQGVAQPGGGSATYSGTFEADIVGNTINFLGGSFDVVASNSLTPLLPGATPGNYGMITLNGKTAALREFRFSFEKENTSVPFNIGPDGLLLDPDRGDADFPPNLDASWVRSRNGDQFEDGVLLNSAPGSTLTQIPGGYELEIFVDTFIMWSEVSSGDSEFSLMGKIVATSVIPEPGAMGLLLAGGTALIGRRRRR